MRGGAVGRPVLGVLLLALAIAGCSVPARTGQPATAGTESPGASSAEGVPTPSPTVAGPRPYRLSIGDASQSHAWLTIATASDCAPLPTAWLRSFCSLTLGPTWQSIIAPTDPFSNRPAAGPGLGWSASWYATMARAAIDGDVSFCQDVSAREWISAGPRPVAPPPGSTFAPARPIADCRAWLQSTAAAGSFDVIDQVDSSQAVWVAVDPAAAEHARAGSDPAFDPLIACTQVTRDVCGQLIAAVTTALGGRSASVQALLARSAPVACLAAATCPPPPDGGNWVGSVVATTQGNASIAFDVEELNVTITAVEVPFPTLAP